MKTKKLTLISMLLGLALIIFTVEAQIPSIAPIPGIKLGFANVINIMALYMLGRKESFIILVLRIVLSSYLQVVLRDLCIVFRAVLYAFCLLV